MWKKCKDRANDPISIADRTWEIWTMKVGDNAMRIAKNDFGEHAILREVRFAPQIYQRLPLETPFIEHSGQDTDIYPFSWLVHPWINGVPTDFTELNDDGTDILVDFFNALHRLELDGLEIYPYRCDLAARSEDLYDSLEEICDSAENHILVLDIWQQGLKAPAAPKRRTVHADLHPKNLLCHHDLPVGVVDWGSIGIGDPVVDLSILWMIYHDRAKIEKALERYNYMDEGLSLRARAWAVLFLAIMLEPHFSYPRNTKIGKTILRNLTLTR